MRFTLAYNPGAAFSMSLGPYSRYIFGTFAVIALFVLWRLYRLSGPAKRAGDRVRILALGLAWGGAAGNLFDRLSTGEVTDFVHFSFWYVFNAADAAITVGVAALIFSALRPAKVDQRPARDQG